MDSKAQKAHLIADTIRIAAGKKKYKPTSAVIVAAGDSTRMLGLDKQFINLSGIPVLLRTIKAFEQAECISEIIVVTAEEKINKVIELCEQHGICKLTAVVPGGATRQESVWNGFLQINDNSDFVAIHDGARCLITPEMIERVCREAYIYGAATAANRVLDSVKLTNKNSFIDKSEDRNKVWLAQTPQVFGANLYRAAAYTAREANFFATDDCSLAERIDFNSIKLVECGRENIKLTTPDDIKFAEAILAARNPEKL